MEQLVEPVDEENDTLPVSIETITESFTGAQPEEGAVGVEEGEIATTPRVQKDKLGIMKW